MRKFWTRLKDPIIVDRSIDVVAALYWFLFAAWGITSTLTGIPTVAQVSTPMYELLWGGAIGILSSIAFVAAFSTLFNTPSIATRIRRKKIELLTLFPLTGFIAVYPIFLLVTVAYGDFSRLATLFVAFSYLLFPVWRTRHLFQRIKVLRSPGLVK